MLTKTIINIVIVFLLAFYCFCIATYVIVKADNAILELSVMQMDMNSQVDIIAEIDNIKTIRTLVSCVKYGTVGIFLIVLCDQVVKYVKYIKEEKRKKENNE